MFTNEFKEKYSETYVLDETDMYEDLIIKITDTQVILIQDEDHIIISIDQFKDMLLSLKCGEGLFKSKYETNSIKEVIN